MGFPVAYASMGIELDWFEALVCARTRLADELLDLLHDFVSFSEVSVECLNSNIMRREVKFPPAA